MIKLKSGVKITKGIGLGGNMISAFTPSGYFEFGGASVNNFYPRGVDGSLPLISDFNIPPVLGGESITVINLGGYIDDLKSITGLYIQQIDAGALFYCLELQSLNFPIVTQIGDSAFGECVQLTDINMPNLINLGTACFRGCTSLVEINLPSVTHIGAENFLGLSALLTVNIPSCTYVGDWTFYNSGVTSITIGAEAEIGTNNNGFQNDYDGRAGTWTYDKGHWTFRE